MITRTGRGLILILAVGACGILTPRLKAQGQSQAKRSIGVLVFEVTPQGLSPSSVTVEQGWYQIRVRNGVSLSALSVRMNHESRGNVVQTSIKAASSAVQSLAKLEPGKHTISVGGQARWTATVVVLPETVKK